jgi:hypothetical protein
MGDFFPPSEITTTRKKRMIFKRLSLSPSPGAAVPANLLFTMSAPNSKENTPTTPEKKFIGREQVG